MKSFKASDYNEYNTRLGLFNYGYLHRLLDLIYKVHFYYKIPINNNIVTLFYSDFGNQIELNNTMYLNINVRVAKHKAYFKKIWKKRHGHGHACLKLYKQLTLF